MTIWALWQECRLCRMGKQISGRAEGLIACRLLQVVTKTFRSAIYELAFSRTNGIPEFRQLVSGDIVRPSENFACLWSK
jgi:hypothetical protein